MVFMAFHPSERRRPFLVALFALLLAIGVGLVLL